MTRRIIIVAVLALVVLAIGWRLVRGHAVPVEIAYATAVDAGKMEAAPVLSGSGYIVTGERYVSIGVRVAGRIDRYFIEEGQTVGKGDALVQLDDRDYRAAVGRVEAGLVLARAMRIPIMVMLITAILMPEWLSGSWGADLRLPVALPFILIG